MNTNLTTIAHVTLKVSTVASVYSGKAGACCCGCSGNHRYASAHVAYASKHRGYEVTPDEVNDRQVKRVVNLINAAEHQDIDESSFGAHVSIELDGRLYVAYLAK